MKIVIAGGTGALGSMLAQRWCAAGHALTVLSRSPRPERWTTMIWDGKHLGEWAAVIDGADVVLNLAGRSVNCRYTASNRRAMMDSRIDSTRVIAEAIVAAQHPPATWLQMSTATIYDHRFDAANDEANGLIGGDAGDPRWRFSVEIARNWEAECLRADTPQTRRVLLRTAMAMGRERDGIFATLLGIVKRGLGGPIAGGAQYVSWIHRDDFCRALDFLIAHPSIDGPVNVAAPTPLPYMEFMRDLRIAAGVRVGLPATRWMIRLGTWAMGTESELVLKSRRVVPKRLLDAGFTFEYPTWPAAAAQLLRAM